MKFFKSKRKSIFEFDKFQLQVSVKLVKTTTNF
uniref:Uncharacterized protein n=1 Tax=Rhizophora mucronata TaxID=61149 RepID=A0A2P2NDQ8_RHIMU